MAELTRRAFLAVTALPLLAAWRPHKRRRLYPSPDLYPSPTLYPRG